MVLSDQDYRLIAEIQGGLPLTSHPYAEIGRRIGLDEKSVIERIDAMQSSGVIKRLGIVVRHHELGYTANAMVVWDVPDHRIDEVGEKLGALDCITLCYQRPRRLPDWPYNLFCMIHGQEREKVLAYIDKLVNSEGLDDIPHKVLFSGRRFKQRGARYQ
ncbi:siroheme decarboxylase subunit beta [Sedimenticola selenatireducens]|jgi:DNA-binding Lrp family transcriptional regulator|uniref:siroheme decarboxylase n=1 Tax=Sedimenticola selenatireducens TaxID=191960 RepID=A0A558DQ61_9GAMM|nr:Lrp/AsnC family transcriptional regulator [Sedimenticola selenatireducens]TVO71680.1 Lrp/AsnC family transcriptional regulator [Sedimenticola selenatireducens]TVT63154.1 MAG: Lrp/AsnC family transcriptional regulator [Sedimenticola selenatireducens]